jgi:hypothetical protein
LQTNLWKYRGLSGWEKFTGKVKTAFKVGKAVNSIGHLFAR